MSGRALLTLNKGEGMCSRKKEVLERFWPANDESEGDSNRRAETLRVYPPNLRGLMDKDRGGAKGKESSC